MAKHISVQSTTQVRCGTCHEITEFSKLDGEHAGSGYPPVSCKCGTIVGYDGDNGKKLDLRRATVVSRR
jgi:hypothetical protein